MAISTRFRSIATVLVPFSLVIFAVGTARTASAPASGTQLTVKASVDTGGRNGGVAQASATEDVHDAPGLVAKYCIACHNEKQKRGNLILEGRTAGNIGEEPEIWEKVLRRVRNSEMPPAGAKRMPSESERVATVTSLGGTLDLIAAAHPHPDRTIVHRLNRNEYSNAVRDLLALDTHSGDQLPIDDSGYGFDNIAAVLSSSPALLERYMTVARRTSALAVGDLSTQPVDQVYVALRDQTKIVRNEQNDEDLPFDSREGVRIQHYFPVDAEYTFKIDFPKNVSVQGATLERIVVEVRAPVRAGLRTVVVTSPRENLKVESETPPDDFLPINSRAVRMDGPKPADLFIDGARIRRFEVMSPGPDVDRVTIGGPYAATSRGTTASRTRIFVCRPTTITQEAPCAKTIFSTLARRAFRRPVADGDVQPLMGFFKGARAAGRDFDAGIQQGLEALLVSPDFLFRVERESQSPTSVAARASSINLASRLSFFLWSSIPDDELLRLAEQDKLKDPVVLRGQVERMLRDPRSDALVANFFGQWLQLKSLRDKSPDPYIFPFDETLRASMTRETELFVTSLVRENRSVLDVFNADYTYLNQRMAEHYGVRGIYGGQFRRVQVVDPNRRGLLAQASILTLTSYPNRTSVVLRGKWVLETLLGTPPPPPPPDVPPFDSINDGKLHTVRETMEIHRKNPVCASCHSKMDPLGFALENFDGIGKWRTKDAGQTIDTTGTLPDGTMFKGASGLTELMKTKYRDAFVQTAIEKMLTYALGRGVEYYDMPTVRAIARDAAGDDFKMSSLVIGIVNSTPFQVKRTS